MFKSAICRPQLLLASALMLFSIGESQADDLYPDVTIAESTMGLIAGTELGVAKVWEEDETAHASLTMWDPELLDEYELPVVVDTLVDVTPSSHWRVIAIQPAEDDRAGFVRLRQQPD